MDRREIDTKIGLSDSEVVSLTTNIKGLRIEILAWDASTIWFVFDEVLSLLYCNTSLVLSVWEITEEDDFFRNGLSWGWDGDPPADHPFKHYCFLDEDDLIAIEVVATEMKVEYVPRT